MVMQVLVNDLAKMRRPAAAPSPSWPIPSCTEHLGTPRGQHRHRGEQVLRLAAPAQRLTLIRVK